MKCVISGCDNEGTLRVTVLLPERLDPETFVVESERQQDVWVCDGHPRLLLRLDSLSLGSGKTVA